MRLLTTILRRSTLEKLLFKGIVCLFCVASILLGADYEPGVVLVKLKPASQFSVSSTQTDLSSFNPNSITPIQLKKEGFSLSSVSEEPLYKLTFEKNRDLEALSDFMASQSGIVYAEPNYYVYSFDVNDPRADDQAYYSDTDLKSLNDIPENNEVLVAVVDSGLDVQHEDIQGRLYDNSLEQADGLDNDGNGYVDDINGYDFVEGRGIQLFDVQTDPKGHGTHMAGIIGANTNNRIGIAGLSQKARLMPVRFMDADGRGTQLDAAMALRYAVDQGARIINCSWGFSSYNTVLKEAIEYAHSKGVLVIAAVGNDATKTINYPAGFDDVLGVAAIYVGRDTRIYFSNYNSSVDYAEYGDNILSLAPGNDYVMLSGTSQAAAVLTGIMAHMLAFDSTQTSEDLILKLNQSVKDIQYTGEDEATGKGRVDVALLKQAYNISDSDGECKTIWYYLSGKWL